MPHFLLGFYLKSQVYIHKSLVMTNSVLSCIYFLIMSSFCQASKIKILSICTPFQNVLYFYIRHKSSCEFCQNLCRHTYMHKKIKIITMHPNVALLQWYKSHQGNGWSLTHALFYLMKIYSVSPPLWTISCSNHYVGMVCARFEDKIWSGQHINFWGHYLVEVPFLTSHISHLYASGEFLKVHTLQSQKPSSRTLACLFDLGQKVKFTTQYLCSFYAHELKQNWPIKYVTSKYL